jgi:hypothetical protein
MPAERILRGWHEVFGGKKNVFWDRPLEAPADKGT